jgi:hypothetical protein
MLSRARSRGAGAPEVCAFRQAPKVRGRAGRRGPEGPADLGASRHRGLPKSMKPLVRRLPGVPRAVFEVCSAPTLVEIPFLSTTGDPRPADRAFAAWTAMLRRHVLRRHMATAPRPASCDAADAPRSGRDDKEYNQQLRRVKENNPHHGAISQLNKDAPRRSSNCGCLIVLSPDRASLCPPAPAPGPDWTRRRLRAAGFLYSASGMCEGATSQGQLIARATMPRISSPGAPPPSLPWCRNHRGG